MSPNFVNLIREIWSNDENTLLNLFSIEDGVESVKYKYNC